MDNTEQRILETTIAVIEEAGYHNVTVRRIAAKAGVNIAAINYYFRSKEQLLGRVLDMMIDSAFDWSELAHTDSLPPKEQLFAVLEHLSKGAQSLPEITRAFFFEALVRGNYEARAVQEFNRYMENVYGKLILKGIPMEETALRMSVSALFMTGMFCVGVIPGVVRPFLGTDLKNDAERKKYLRHLVSRLFDF
jgi:AcrR family transcriptional regulator